MLLCDFVSVLLDDGNDVGALRKFFHVRGDKTLLLDHAIFHVCVPFSRYNGIVVVRNMESHIKEKLYDNCGLRLCSGYGIMSCNDGKCLCL